MRTLEQNLADLPQRRFEIEVEGCQAARGWQSLLNPWIENPDDRSVRHNGGGSWEGIPGMGGGNVRESEGMYSSELYYMKPVVTCYGGSSPKDYSVGLRIAGDPWILSVGAARVKDLAVRRPTA